MAPTGAGRSRPAALRGERLRPTTGGVHSILTNHPATDLTASRLAAILRESELPGGTQRYLELAEETATMQLYRHPDLGRADYERLQRTVSEGEVLPEPGGRTAAIFLYDGRWYEAVLKGTAHELYLVSYHRTTQRKVVRRRKRH